MISFNSLRARLASRYGAGSVKRLAPVVLGPISGLAVAAFCLTGTAQARPLRLVAFGDSLTAGYQLPESDGFAPKLEAALRKQGYDVTVVNAGVSGDTTTGGLARLDWSLADGADAVILELGANDMLRGIAPNICVTNLSKMLENMKAKHVKVLLAGMLAMPNMDHAYVSEFDAVYPNLAKKYDVMLYPFFLNGIIGDRSQHLPDQMHPNAKGVDTIVAHILPAVDKLLGSVDASRVAARSN